MSDERFVLLWGVPGDSPIMAAYTALQELGCPTLFLDQWKVADTGFDLAVSYGVDGEISTGGVLRYGGSTYDLSTIRAAYMRPNDPTEMSHVIRVGPESELWRHATKLERDLMTWADLTPVLVVNRFSAMSANGSKPYQMNWIASLGFNVPETLITTDEAAASAFWEEHGEVVYKSISGTRSIVSRLREEHRERLTGLGACPTQFQQYIPGTEYRVHVVGEQVYACRIVSNADDYRYAIDPVEFTACELEAPITHLCRNAGAEMGLPLAGIDLRCTPAGVWYCLEVNPSPEFTAFEVNEPSIAGGLARMLARGRTGP